MMTNKHSLFFFILLFMSFHSVAATASMENRTVEGFFVDNTHKDKLICGDANDSVTDEYDCIFFLKNKEKKWVIKDNNHCSYFKIKQGEQPGEVKVECGHWGESTDLFYKYDNTMNNWFLFKKIYKRLPMFGPDDADSFTKEEIPLNQWSIDKELLKIKNVTSLSQLVTAVEKKYKKKKYTEIRAIAKTYPFTSSNLTTQTVLSYNNLAFYYQQAGAHQQAIAILSDIAKQFPNRTVAYLNLGDTYLEQGNTQKARHYHQLYVTQMKAQGKESLIPKRIIEIPHGKQS